MITGRRIFNVGPATSETKNETFDNNLSLPCVHDCRYNDMSPQILKFADVISSRAAGYKGPGPRRRKRGQHVLTTCIAVLLTAAAFPVINIPINFFQDVKQHNCSAHDFKSIRLKGAQ